MLTKKECYMSGGRLVGHVVSVITTGNFIGIFDILLGKDDKWC